LGLVFAAPPKTNLEGSILFDTALYKRNGQVIQLPATGVEFGLTFETVYFGLNDFDQLVGETDDQFFILNADSGVRTLIPEFIYSAGNAGIINDSGAILVSGTDPLTYLSTYGVYSGGHYTEVQGFEPQGYGMEGEFAANLTFAATGLNNLGEIVGYSQAPGVKYTPPNDVPPNLLNVEPTYAVRFVQGEPPVLLHYLPTRSQNGSRVLN
jgi:hypothetical protein